VYAGHLNMDDFWSDRLGVTFGRVDTGPNSNIYSTLESWTDDHRAIVDRMLDRIYGDFLERVSESRGLTRDQVDAVGRGRVWTGVQAFDHGLVDQLGGFSDAVAVAKELAGIEPDVRVSMVDYPRLLPWWQEMVRRRSEDEVALRSLIEDLDEAWRTGSLDTPGVLWMPPIYIE
jgi:protease-4